MARPSEPPGIVDWNLYDSTGAPTLTQFDQASAVSANAQNGFPPAQLTGVALGTNGLIEATYSNGLQQTVGELAIGTVQNTQSLASAGNNNLSLTALRLRSRWGRPERAAAERYWASLWKPPPSISLPNLRTS
jgi:flagellar hook protein FlgE